MTLTFINFPTFFWFTFLREYFGFNTITICTIIFYRNMNIITRGIFPFISFPIRTGTSFFPILIFK